MGLLEDHRCAMAIPAPIDVAGRFGPLSSIHAALDQAGAGMPCSAIGYFPNAQAQQIKAALDRAIEETPLLAMRMAWIEGRPWLTPVEQGAMPGYIAGSSELLTFSPAATSGCLWAYRLVDDGKGVWLMAAWGHAVADGASMMRLFQDIAAALQGRTRPSPRVRTAKNVKKWPFLLWLPQFLFDQWRSYLPLPGTQHKIPGACWSVVAPATWAAIHERCQGAGFGFGAWLGAAVSLVLYRLAGTSRSQFIHLNFPIDRASATDRGSFKFAVGSLLIPLRINGGDDVASLSTRLHIALRTRSRQGWDINLNRFLGRNPARHRLFARIECSARVNNSVSISWKGTVDGLGTEGGVTQTACFAATPSLHISAHADADGLHLSLASNQSPDTRRNILSSILEAIGAGASFQPTELASIGQAAHLAAP